jgi:PAS domain S-box-containing protein
MKFMSFSTTAALEQWPWPVRGLLGCAAGCFVLLLPHAIAPLRAFPVVFAFPAIILSVWFLGMRSGILCTITEAVFVKLLMVKIQVPFSDQDVPQGLRLTIFFVFSILFGWAIRRLAQQHTQLKTQELQRRLLLAQGERQLAEERAHISETLRERDEMLQIALDGNGMGLWVLDFEQGTTQWSDEMFRIAGREPGSVTPSTELWQSWLHPEDVEGVREALARTREGGQHYHQQYRLLWPDKSVRWLESQAKYLRNSEGRVARVVGVLADVTPRKMTEEAMLRTQKLAVAGRMAAAVAHEINNPLEAVENLLYLISTAETTELVRSYAHMAIEGLTRISLVTQQTLKFHRQSGAPALTKLSEVVSVVLALFSPRLRSAGIATEIRVVGEERVECMPSETHHIFANLVSNAIDAMPRGGRLVIRVRPSRDWRNGKTPGMRVTVADSGMGMSRATMRHSFEPFFTTKTDTGTGLGLWVVAQLVERRDGHVRGWSTQLAEVSGTAFSVFLPFGAAPGTGAPTTSSQSC